VYIGDDWPNGIKLLAAPNQWVVLRDDSCGESIELQCGFRGSGSWTNYCYLSNYTQNYSSGSVVCSNECDDNPNLGNTVNSIKWNTGTSPVFDP